MCVPVPLPPVAKGEPRVGVSVPSPCRSKAATVLATAVLSFTYTCPTTSDLVDALADAVAVPATASAISPMVVAIRLSKRTHAP
jgi:hypothetical protein